MEAASGQRDREENKRGAEEERDAESGGEIAGESVEPFELQPSIIDVVAKLCPKNEADEIWRVVGHSLVEQAKDLLEEVGENRRISSLFWCALIGITTSCRQVLSWKFGGS